MNEGRVSQGKQGKITVSVIMIFLDAERFIAEAIDSVFSQTRVDWELILVDDGSTDGSAGIVSSYVEAHPDRIRLLSHPGGKNLGTGASRQLGLLNARGEYIAFLDSDDIWLPEKLARQVARMDASPTAQMVYGPTMLWHSWQPDSISRPRDALRLLGVRPERLIDPPNLIPRFLRERALPPSTCGLLVRRAAALSAGGFDERFRGMYEDQAFLYKLCLRETVYVSGECWDLYRQHPYSTTIRSEASGWYDDNGPSLAHRDFLDWFAAYAEREGRLEPEIARALRIARLPYTHPLIARVWRRLDTFVTKRLRRAGLVPM